jgi:seryl-tRNA synthetase
MKGSTNNIYNMDKKSLEALFDKKLAPLSSKIIEMSKSLNVATESLQFISDKYDELIKRMEESEQQRTLIMKENSELKAELTKVSTEIAALHHMVNEQEQYGRRDCLEFRGIPASNSYTPEQTDEIAIKISEAVGVKIQKEDISISLRLPARRLTFGQALSSSPPPIIAKFTRRNVQDEIYSARKNLRNISTSQFGFESQNKIFIVESLTKGRTIRFLMGGVVHFPHCSIFFFVLQTSRIFFYYLCVLHYMY